MIQYPSTQGVPSEYRGVEQLVARRAHNPEVVGSSPASATISSVHNGFDRCGHSIFFLQKVSLAETEFVHTNSLLVKV